MGKCVTALGTLLVKGDAIVLVVKGTSTAVLVVGIGMAELAVRRGMLLMFLGTWVVSGEGYDDGG